jgi:methionyl aminopeptidase
VSRGRARVVARRSAGLRPVTARSADELRIMRRAGRVVAEMHEELRRALRPGVSTAALDSIAREVLARRGATSNFLGYHGYPAVICASVNDVVVHGIPSPTVLLAEGDVVSIDCGAVVEGWHGDAAFSAAVGSVPERVERLLAAVDEALAAAVAAMRAGNHVGDIGCAVAEVAARRSVGIVEDYGGHGIGQAMHEEPLVPNQGRPGQGRPLVIGSVLAIEPMFTLGGGSTFTERDGWTVRTNDGSWSAHSEHTVAVTDHGPEVLTRP